MSDITQADIAYLLRTAKRLYPKILHEDAEDVVQNALLRYYRDNKNDPRKGSLRTFLTLILKTELTNYFSKLYAAKRDASKTDSLTITPAEDAETGEGWDAGDSQRDLPDVDPTEFSAGTQPDAVTGAIEVSERTEALDRAIATLSDDLIAAVESALSGDKTWPCKSPRCPSKLELARRELRNMGIELPIPAIKLERPPSYSEQREQLQADIDAMSTNYFAHAPGVTESEVAEYNKAREARWPELQAWAKQGMKAQGFNGGWAPDKDTQAAINRGNKKWFNYRRGKAGGRPKSQPALAA